MNPKGIINNLRRKTTRFFSKIFVRDKLSEDNFSQNITQVKKILVSRPNHRLGNNLLLTPLITEISEIFPNHLRNSGQSFGVSVHWVLAAIIPSLVPLLFASIGPGVVFSIFAGFMVLQLMFVHFMMPETKGISLEELSKKLVS